MPIEPSLNRTLSLPMITFYGLGTIIGAGIYVLIGAVASKAGIYAPLSFLLAAIIAGFTAFSYAELSSRLPFSAGEAAYVQEAFAIHWLSAATGLTVVGIGLVSSATLANGIVGYLAVFITLPDWLVICALVIGLGLIAAWGIKESVWVATIITLLEIGGLIFVLVIAGDNLLQLPDRWQELIPPPSGEVWGGIMLGAFVAFYAYIGFEDMVNVAEEIKDAPRNLPKAIILALIISTILYLSIALVAVLALPISELATSEAPLATLMEVYGREHGLLISGISLIAVLNGALIQIIMVSRVLYGMASRGMINNILAKVNARTRTPLHATGLTTGVILILALWLPLATLAQITSFITLTVFAGVNASLIRLKLSKRQAHGGVSYPLWVPIAGCGLCILFLGMKVKDFLI